MSRAKKLKQQALDGVEMKCFESDEFNLLVDKLERAADALAACGRRLHGKSVPPATLIGAAIGRAAQRLERGELAEVDAAPGGIVAAAARLRGRASPT